MNLKKYLLFLLSVSLLFLSCNKLIEKKVYTGFKLTPKDILSKVDEATAPLVESGKLPSSVDLSNDFPPPGNQGYQNSCIGWAVAYGMKTYQEKKDQKWEIVQTGSIVRDKVFSPSYVYNQINGGRDMGGELIDAFNILQKKGCVTMASFPYDEDNYRTQPERSLNTEASKFKIAWSKKINPENSNTIKSYLAEGIPVIIGLTIDDDFMNLEGPTTITRMGNNGGLGHAMVVIGYDDDKDCYRLLNSWGKQWRDNGYCWMTYDVFKKTVDEAWVTKDMESSVEQTEQQVVEQEKEEDEYAKKDDKPLIDEYNSGLTLTNVEYGVRHHDYAEYGPLVKIEGTVNLNKAYGRYAQIVVYFTYEDGTPVETDNYEFATVDGQACGYTPDYMLESVITTKRNFTVYVPYAVLGITPRTSSARFCALPVLFIDNYDATEGDTIAINIRGR